MADYIDREAAFAALRTQEEVDKDCWLPTGRRFDSLRACAAVGSIPAADVVEVVRCKDCKFWNRGKISCEGLARCITGETGIRFRNGYDYCSRGVREE